MRARLPLVSITATLVALAALPRSSARAEPPTGHVRSVRATSIYLDLGRRDGVAAGDELTAGATKLRVVHLGERQIMAEVVSGPAPRVGATVTAARERPSGVAKRPVVTLPAPRPPLPLPWRDEPARRMSLVPAPSSTRTAARSTVRGELRLTWSSSFDDGPGDLDLHRAELRSLLALPDVATIAGGHLAYQHDLAGRVELGPRLDSRAGSDSRPLYKVRQLTLGWGSAGWGDRRTLASSLALGRLTLPDPTSPGLVDGARAELVLGHGLTAGVWGGLVPAVLDIAPSADAAAIGGRVAWSGGGPDWRARAAISSAVSMWQGALSRVDLGASGLVALGRDLDLHASVIGTLVDPGLVVDEDGGDGQPAASLTRGYLGARIRPLWWLVVDASYAHDRLVVDRELAARLGPDTFVTAPRESAWLQVRFDPDRTIGVALSGSLGFGDDAAEQQGGAARVTLRDLGLQGLHAASGYRFTQTPVVRAHTIDVDLALPIGDLALVDLGYAFSTFQSRLLDERQDEHRVTLAADITPRAPWRVHLGGFLARGHLPGQIGLMAQLAWRFR
ncbi:MAG: hypothetical protein IT385_27095 [Deltaproteobacteria bacterium]|nr:hypothetical protein [Deltaproteobacteria bacterium]